MAKKKTKTVQTSVFNTYYEVRESESGKTRLSTLSYDEAQRFSDLLYKTEGIGFVVDEVDRTTRNEL